MHADDLVALNEQIVAMAKAGLPLDQGLESLAHDMQRGQLKTVTKALAQDMRAGQTLAEAIENQPAIPPYYSSLVTAGVQSGQLAQVLTTLTSYARSIALTRSSIIEALFYPLIILLIGISLFAILAFFVLPQFDALFTEMDLTVPWLTSVVVEGSRDPFLYFILPVSLILLGIVLLGMYAKFSEQGLRRFNTIMYQTPVLGKLIHAVRLQSLIQLLAILVRYGTPLPRAFQLAGATSPDPAIRNQCAKIATSLEQGQSMGDTLKKIRLLPQWLAWVASLGESKSDLPGALDEIAEFYRRRFSIQILVLRSILPPLIVLFTGGVLAFIFSFAVMAPMVKLLEALGRIS